MLFYQTRSHAIVLYDTLPAVCIEKVVCMKAKDVLYQKVRLTSVPRVVLKSNSQIGLQRSTYTGEQAFLLYLWKMLKNFA